MSAAVAETLALGRGKSAGQDSGRECSVGVAELGRKVAPSQIPAARSLGEVLRGHCRPAGIRLHALHCPLPLRGRRDVGDQRVERDVPGAPYQQPLVCYRPLDDPSHGHAVWGRGRSQHRSGDIRLVHTIVSV